MKVGAFMQHVLSSQELYMHLTDFRQILMDFDSTHIGNLRFMNLESVYAYIENATNRSFNAHHNKLEETLDILQPYLPFLSSDRAKEFLVEISKVTSDYEVEQLKEKYTKKLKVDFINTINKLTCDEDWQLLIDVCEHIRFRKEESYLH